MRRPLTVPPELVSQAPLLLTVEQAARALNIGRNKVYGLVMTGDLRSVRIGKASRRIVRSSIDELIQQLEAEEEEARRAKAS